MKIQRFINKTISFINTPISKELEQGLRSGLDDFEYGTEEMFLKMRDDIHLFVEKKWMYVKEANSVMLESIALGYGKINNDEYIAIDETTFRDLYSANVPETIEYLIGCAFPNAKIER